MTSNKIGNIFENKCINKVDIKVAQLVFRVVNVN